MTPELKELIAARLSIEEILDILGWENFDLVEALESYMNEWEEEFKEALE